MLTPRPLKIAIRIPLWLGYGREIFRGIGNYMSEQRLNWKVEAKIDADGELKPLNIDDHWKGHGAIIFRYSDTEAEAFRARNVPLISVSRVSQCPWVPRVHADNHMVGRLAAEHLIGTGSPRLACWIDPNRSYSLERKEGFLEGAESYRREVIILEDKASLYPESSKWSEINVAMQEQVKSLPPSTSIFARDDLAATGLMQTAASLGIRIPDDLAILGVGNDPILNSITTPSMSSVAIPAQQVGWNAAHMLHQRLETKQPYGKRNSPGEVVELPVREVIRRETTNHLHVQDSLVAEACHLIKTTKGPNRINAKSLSTALNVSSTTLLNRFQASMAMSPKRFIDRTRCDEATHLLVQTSWSVKEIAYEMGFRSPEEFGRFFKRHSGHAPGEFRRS